MTPIDLADAVKAGKRPLRANLYELGLASEDPERLAQFYADALGYRFVRAAHALNGAARDRRLTVVSGPSRSLAYAAFAVADAGELGQLEGRLARARASFEADDHLAFEPGALKVRDPDGNLFRFGVAVRSPDAAGEDVAVFPARLQHVVFASRNVERLAAFLTDVIGFTLSDRVRDEQARLRTVFLRCGSDHHSIAVFAADEDRLDHHCYEAGDWDLIRDWADHFAALRIPLKWGPGRHGPGNNLFVFIHDPDGNWVEISAELEQVEPDRPVGEWPHEERTLNSWGIGLLRS